MYYKNSNCNFLQSILVEYNPGEDSELSEASKRIKLRFSSASKLSDYFLIWLITIVYS